MSIILKNYELWTSSVFDKKTISNVIDLKEKNPVDFEDSFYKELEFGTGGMRELWVRVQIELINTLLEKQHKEFVIS